MTLHTTAALGNRSPRRLLRRAAPVLAALLAAAAGGCAGSSRTAGSPNNPAPAAAKAAEERLTPEQVAANVESFDRIWEIVRDRHYDATLGGVDWDAAKAELRPRVEAAEYPSEAREAMSELVSRIGQSHFGIISAEAYAEMSGADRESGGSRRPGYVGIDVRVVGDDAVITRVRPGSPAEAVGVRPGYILLEINGRNVRERLDALREADIQIVGNPATLPSAVVESRLRGSAGSTLTLRVLDGEGRETETSIVRGEYEHQPIPFGNVPPIPVLVETGRIEGDIGYFGFTAFLDAPRVVADFNAAIESFRGTRGMIIDLRGNLGGLAPMTMGMGGWFVTEPNQRLGTQRMRDFSINYVLNPRAEPYTAPLAILIDELSVSSAEILASGLKDLGRARLFGTRTAGQTLPSQFERLPNGDVLQYVFADYVSVSGHRLEGNGVEPDETVTPDRQSLLRGEDPAIAAAVRWIRSSAGAH